MQTKQLKKLSGLQIQAETEDSGMAASKYFQELLWMFKYSFENTGVHPSLATKLSQIVIRRDDLDLCKEFSNLKLPQGISAQASHGPNHTSDDRKLSFDANSPIKDGDLENDLQLGDPGDAFMSEKNCLVTVSDEVTKLVLD